MGEDQQRLAINESVFREVNERIEELGERLDAGRLEFLCECADPACVDRLSLTTGEYERVRSEPDRFLVVPGHQQPEIERVLEQHDRYLIVQKLGEAGAIAKASDPRAD